MNELVKIDINSIVEIEKKSLSDVIKPLKKEIVLSDYYVNDVNELCSDLVFGELKKNTKLELKADNMLYRATTVGIYFNGKRIGELYEGQEIIPYNLLIAGKELTATIKNVHISMNKKVLQISIKMLDF